MQELIDLIGNATQCSEWQSFVSKHLKENQTVPPYLRSFHTLVSDYGEITNSETSNWIQRYIKEHAVSEVMNFRKSLKTRLEIKKDEISNYILKQKINVNNPKECEKFSNGLKGRLYLNTASKPLESLEEIRQDNIEEWTDHFTNQQSWSVLSLFFHSAICNVNVSSGNSSKFAFWPATSPLLNNRHVELKEIYNSEETGFIQQMCGNNNHSWSNQAARTVPYCVTTQTKNNDIKLHPILGTTTKGLSLHTEEGGESKYENGEDFAGELRATELTYGEVNNLHKALTCLELEDGTYAGTILGMKPSDRAFFGLQTCMDLLGRRELFGRLATIQDWCKLYVQLKMDDTGFLDMDQKIMLPTTAVDLVHKTRLLFQSRHRVRFSFIEGQKRATSTTYGLIGFVPQDKFVFHGDLEKDQYQIGGDKNVCNKDVNHDDVEIFDKKNPLNSQFTIRNGGKSTPVLYYQFKTRQPIFDELIVSTCKKYSAYLVAEGNKEQIRSWMNVVLNATSEISIREHLLLTPKTKDIWNKKSDLETFVNSFRVSMMQQFWRVDSQAQCLIEDCKDSTEMILAIRNLQDTETEFVEKALYKFDSQGGLIIDKSKKPVNKSKLTTFGFDMKSPPYPRICHSITLLFLHVGFGSTNGLNLLTNIATLQGKKSTAKEIRKELTFDPYPEDYKEMVR